MEVYLMRMSQAEINALNDVVSYVLDTEADSYEHELRDGGGEGHIYSSALVLQKWIEDGSDE
jgi:hypothetical protein